MKKLLPILIIVLIAGGIWFLAESKRSGSPAPQTNAANSTAASSPTKPGPGAEAPSNPTTHTDMQTSANNTTNSSDEESDEDEEAEFIVKPAAQVYKSADEALEAVKNGSKDYDDTILEQFSQPGDDCTWCNEFYKAIKDAVSSPDLKSDQKSYYSELLAISGRTDNIQTLVDSIKNAKNSDEADLFAEALELSAGNDDVTKLLGEQMNSTNETLKEASVAAVTNQGSKVAAELLIKNTIERGDPDGYYSLGIGIGEFIPDEDAIPLIQAMVEKRDQFSPLGVKALLNSGLNGLKLVFDELEASKNPEADRILIKDAIDHVNYEEGVEEFAKEKLNSKNPVAAELAKQIHDELVSQGEE